MSNWMSVFNEIEGDLDRLELIKEECLNEVKNNTGRELICYYSAFLTKNKEGLEINDQDMIGIMNAVYGLDYSKGLDLILHTPGGDPAAAELIVEYLRELFKGDIRVIVPHMAMSAGTMIAFSANEIVMGNHSCLGPIDPQYGGIPAVDIVSTFEKAKSELAKSPEENSYWQIELNKYPTGLFQKAKYAIELSEVLVKDWLETGMFFEEDKEEVIKDILEEFNDNKNSKIHGRHYTKEKCKNFGIKIVDLESDQNLQNSILKPHHCYTILLQNTPVYKIIENGNCIRYML